MLKVGFLLWCLVSLSAIFQLYCGDYVISNVTRYLGTTNKCNAIPPIMRMIDSLVWVYEMRNTLYTECLDSPQCEIGCEKYGLPMIYDECHSNWGQLLSNVIDCITIILQFSWLHYIMITSIFKCNRLNYNYFVMLRSHVCLIRIENACSVHTSTNLKRFSLKRFRNVLNCRVDMIS